MEKAGMVKRLRELVVEFNKISNELSRSNVKVNPELNFLTYNNMYGGETPFYTLSIDPMERIK